MSHRTACACLMAIALLLTEYCSELSLSSQHVGMMKVVEAQGNASHPTSTPAPKPLNLLVDVGQGTMLSRLGWTQFTPVEFGTVVHEHDLLRAESQATVLCADLTLKTITGEQRCPCQMMAPGVLVYEGALVASFARHLRSAPPEIPYVIHPRNTWIADPHPLFQWHHTGVTSYTVSVLAEGETLWSQSDVVSDSIRYPDDASALQAGPDYLLVVKDQYSGNVSTADPEKGLGFRLLGEQERSKIRMLQDKISELASLNEPARNLARALYLANYQEAGRGLWSEAALLLEQVSGERDAPAVRLRQGDVLAAMKLPDEASAAYEAALESAENLGDLESQALVHAALWNLGGNGTYLEKAGELYDELGDEGRIASPIDREEQNE